MGMTVASDVVMRNPLERPSMSWYSLKTSPGTYTNSWVMHPEPRRSVPGSA